MVSHRCPTSCAKGLTRRRFLSAAGASVLSASLVGTYMADLGHAEVGKVRQCGPAGRIRPKVKACFVRREGEYGIRWPGQIYDGEAARSMYTGRIAETAKVLGLRLDMRPEPIYSLPEGEAWVAEAEAAKVDGLLVVVLDRQEHAWPTASKAIDSSIPTVVFSPIGTSFTTNTTAPSQKTGCFIASTDDFSQVEYGMKMLHAGAKMRATRCLVIRGGERAESQVPHLGIALRQVPAADFLAEYERTPVDSEVRALARNLIRHAEDRRGATEDDVINGIKSYLVARTLLEREACDGITMDCLGALGPTKVSLPCIAWSKMNDDGIPAACEADIGAMATHVITQYLFDRPGFQQDPVGETAREAVIGAHCCCPTRLRGFDADPEPYDITHHHGVRDATARTIWEIGQRVTSADVLPGNDNTPTKMIISAGEVLENVSVPPAGGCVVSVMVKFDDVDDVLAYPGFHQVFFYGDYKRELVQFCRLYDFEPMVV